MPTPSSDIWDMTNNRKPKIVKKKKREAQLPPILSKGTIVPALAGFAVVTTLTGGNIAIGFLGGLISGILYWFYLNLSTSRIKEKNPQPTKTPDDIVLGLLSRYAFVTAEPTDSGTRPEAYSLDGLRWSHKLTFETEDGDTDVFVIRGSLLDGGGTLEYVDGESEHTPEYWEL